MVINALGSNRLSVALKCLILQPVTTKRTVVKDGQKYKSVFGGTSLSSSENASDFCRVDLTDAGRCRSDVPMTTKQDGPQVVRASSQWLASSRELLIGAAAQK